MTAPEYHAGMREMFGVTDAGKFLDPELSTRVPVLDLIKFDEWLETLDRYPDRGLSMEQFIVERFGPEAAGFVEHLIRSIAEGKVGHFMS